MLARAGDAPEMKICSCCTRSLPPEKFTKNRARRDGLSWQCRDCKTEIAREWRAKHPDSIAATNQRYEREQQEAARAAARVAGVLNTFVRCVTTNPIAAKSEEGNRAPLTDDELEEIKVLLSGGHAQKEIARQYGVDAGVISAIHTGRRGHAKRVKHLSEPIEEQPKPAAPMDWLTLQTPALRAHRKT